MAASEHLATLPVEFHRAEHSHWGRRRAEVGKRDGDRLGIPGAHENAHNPSAADGREEVLHVHPQDAALSRVRLRKTHRAPPFHKTVRRRMCGDVVENALEDSSLDPLEQRQRCFDQTRCPPAPRDPVKTIVSQPTAGLVVGSPVCPQPAQHFVFETEPRTEFSSCRNSRNRPSFRRTRGRNHPDFVIAQFYLPLHHHLPILLNVDFVRHFTGKP